MKKTITEERRPKDVENVGEIPTITDESSRQEHEETAERRYPVGERKVSMRRFTDSALKGVHSDDEPHPRDALHRKETDAWPEAMEGEVQTLKEMKCWTNTSRPSEQKVLHSKFLLRRKRDRNGNIDNYNARLVATGDQEISNEEEHFSPVSEFSIMKLNVIVAKQRRWNGKHFDVLKEFPTGKLV